MIIPSIYLPIKVELFEEHFKRFFEDYTQIRPDNLEHTLNRIKIGTGRIRYEIEFENLKPSTPPEPKKVICQVEVWEVSDHRIEITAAALDVLTLNGSMGWGEVFLDELYKMINLKWNVKPYFPNVEDSMDMPMNAAQVQLAHDFEITKITSRNVLSSDPDKGNDGEYESTTHPPTVDDEEMIRRIDGFNNALQQGLPPIEAIDEGSQRSTKHGPVTYSDDEKLNAIKDWENIIFHTQTLKEWLLERFGSEGGIPIVATSTFQGWKQQLRKKRLFDSK